MRTSIVLATFAVAAIAGAATANPRCELLARHGAYVRALQQGNERAWTEHAAPDALRFGAAPAGGKSARWLPASLRGVPWTIAHETVLTGRDGELGLVLARWIDPSRGRTTRGSDGYAITAWIRHGESRLRIIADGWFPRPDDRAFRPDMGGCELHREVLLDALDTPAVAMRPERALRDLDNELIASATCRAVWPALARVADETTEFLVHGAGLMRGKAQLGKNTGLLPTVEGRWRRLHQWSDRAGRLAVSAGRIDHCDVAEAGGGRGYIAVWQAPRAGARHALRVFALLPEV